MLDLEHIRKCWVQLNMRIIPKLHLILSHVPFLLRKFNGGFDKLEESRIEASHQSRARDNHRLSRMGDKSKDDKFEAKLQNMRVNKDTSNIQHEFYKFAKRKMIARSLSLKKHRQLENRNIRVTKRNRVKEESESADASTRNLSARKRNLKTIVSVCANEISYHMHCLIDSRH